ncbi:hypothetical protein EGW08_019812, partial [Elysia chlorotica]
MTRSYLSCYSVRDKIDDYYQCSGSGDPLEYCEKSHEFNVVDAPHKGPELRVVSNQPTPTVIEGDILVVLCQIYAVKGGSLIWAIFSPNGTSRTLEHNVNMEIAEEKSSKTAGKTVIASRLEMTVERSFEGSRIACFGYKFSEPSIQECLAHKEMCALSPQIHVGDRPLQSPFRSSKYRPILFGVPFCLLLLLMAAALLAYGESDYEQNSGTNWSQYEDYQWKDDEIYEGDLETETGEAILRADKKKLLCN